MVFLSMFLFLILRFCCNWCGGRNPSPNICCPPSKEHQVYARYTGKDIWRAKIFMLGR